MAISIYYEARRSTPLTSVESAAVSRIVGKYSVNDQILRYLKTGKGLNWESFAVYDSGSQTEVVFEGATKLPDNSEDAPWLGVQHWCAALSEIRNTIPDSKWSVRVEDRDIPWDSDRRRFDPTR